MLFRSSRLRREARKLGIADAKVIGLLGVPAYSADGGEGGVAASGSPNAQTNVTANVAAYVAAQQLTAGGNVANASGQAGQQLLQDAALYALQGLGAQQIKELITYLTTAPPPAPGTDPNDPNNQALLTGPQGELARAWLQGLLGCATQAASSAGSDTRAPTAAINTTEVPA